MGSRTPGRRGPRRPVRGGATPRPPRRTSMRPIPRREERGGRRPVDFGDIRRGGRPSRPVRGGRPSSSDDRGRRFAEYLAAMRGSGRRRR